MHRATRAEATEGEKAVENGLAPIPPAFITSRRNDASVRPPEKPAEADSAVGHLSLQIERLPGCTFAHLTERSPCFLLHFAFFQDRQELMLYSSINPR